MSETSSEANRIERDLEQTRSRLDETIGALQQKLSPGDMVDQAVTYLKETGGGEMGRNLLVSARENPVPLALVGVGLAWLMLSDPEAKRLDRERKERQAELERERHARALAAYRESLPSSFGSDEVSRGYTSADAGASYRGSELYRPSTPVYGGATHAEEAKPGYLTQAGAYASAAVEDLSTKASEAGSSLQQEAEETSEAFQERVSAAKGAVLGLKRDAEETATAFGERIEAALSEAAERYRSWRDSAAAAGEGLLVRSQSLVQGAAAVAGNVYDRGQSLVQGAAGAASSVYSQGTAAAQGVYGQGQALAGSAQALAGSAYEQGTAAARNLYEQGSAAAESLGEGVSSMANQARSAGERGIGYLQDQPLLMGALGVSVGAILASLIPPTRYEDEMLGQTRDRLRDQAQDYVAAAADSASRVAQQVVSGAKESAQRQGLTNVDVGATAAGARSQVSDAASRVRSVVEETLTAGREAVKQELASATDEPAKTDDAAKPGPA